MNIIFPNVKIYLVQNELDVIVGETFQMETLNDFPEGTIVFHSKDPVVSITEDDKYVTVEKLGTSEIKFMTGDTVHKTLIINAVTATQAIATKLNGSLGEPLPK